MARGYGSESIKFKVLTALRSVGKEGITNVELSKINIRYGGYLGNLYQQGYDIRTDDMGNGIFKYTLISEPSKIVKREKAKDVLLKNAVNAGISEEALEKLLNDSGVTVRYVQNTYKK